MTATVAESSWTPVALDQIVYGNYSGPQPTLLRRTDGVGLLYPGAVHSLAGEPGSGKSWVALVAAAELIDQGRNVLYLDFEDSPSTAVHRLKTLGVAPVDLLLHFGYAGPDEPIPDPMPELLDMWLNAVDLVIVDGVTNALEAHGLDPLNNREAAQFMNRVVKRVGNGTRSPAVLLIDHVPKSTRNQRAPIGAQHKVAAVQVQYTVHPVAPFDQDHDGALDVRLVKDRFGEVQRRAQIVGTTRTAARVRFEHDQERRQLSATVIPAGSGTGGDRFSDLVLKAISESPGITRTEIVRSIRGKDSTIASTIDGLIVSGRVSETVDGRSRRYTATEVAAD